MSVHSRLGLATAAALLASAGAQADAPRASVPPLPAYKQECASCHIAYPPGALPAASWQRLLDNLPRHYGSDASLDAATVRQLRGWLTANAGTWRRVAAPPPEDRITRADWFVREHRKVTQATWTLPAVKSPSNCAACHAGAEQGDFDEHAVRIPR